MSFVGTLRPYQAEAADRMIDRGQMLLGIVMGGGKTVVTLAALEEMMAEDDVRRVLVVVPASLKYQWLRETRRFTTSKAIVIDGSPKQRQSLWRFAIGAQYVIVNPETLLNDLKYYRKLRFDAMVIDEATMIKSNSAKRTRMLKRLGKQIYFRFALTGQPIENKAEELFSLMEFVDPRVLGDAEAFDRTFIVRNAWGKVERYRNLPALHASLSDAMVRYSRDDIADELPELIPVLIPVPFDAAGAKAYRRITSDLLSELGNAIAKHGRGFDLWRHYNGQEDNEAAGQIMTRLTTLRMLCDNPELVRRSAVLYNDAATEAGSKYAAEVIKAGWLPETAKTPKLAAVLEYVAEILAEDPRNKVVVFSFFRENLHLIQRATKHLTDSVLFMGGMNAQARDRAKQQFGEDPNTRLFLSSDAGGYGVDLPMANYLISYDLPWSAGKLDQREARIIRMSSEFPHVTVASFVMQGSIEEWQYDKLQMKREINQAFVDGKHHDAKGQFELTLGSLTEFLANSEV